MWYGVAIMAALVIGLVWWMIWAIRRGKKEEKKNGGNE